MGKLSIAPGSTSISLYVFVNDSTSTTGGGRTGLVFNSAGLTAFYVRSRSAPVAITLATLASNAAAWATGGFIEVDATNLPGVYRLDVPDAAFASGSRSVVLYLRGASNMVPLPLEVDLDSEVDVSLWRGTQPNTLTSGRLDATAVIVSDKTGYSLTATTGLGNQTANITGNLSGSVGSVSGNVGGSVGSVVAAVTVGTINTNAITAGSIATSALNGKGDWNIGKTGYALSSSGLDAITVETGLNARQSLAIIASSAAGVLAGAATATVTIAAAGVPATNRITATTDASGNRTAVTLSPPA